MPFSRKMAAGNPSCPVSDARLTSPQLKEEKVRDHLAFHHPKSGGRMFGSTLADVFNTPAYECSAAGSNEKLEFAVTRLRSGPREIEKAPTYPADQAIL